MEDTRQILLFLKGWLTGEDTPVPIGVFISEARKKTSEPYAEAICSRVQLLLAEYSTGHLDEAELRRATIDDVNKILQAARPSERRDSDFRGELLTL